VKSPVPVSVVWEFSPFYMANTARDIFVAENIEEGKWKD
jgi:hypothetical protein